MFTLTRAAVAMAAIAATASAGAAEIKSRTCTPVEVAVMSNRLHVKCAPIAGQAYTGDITYYAMALSEEPARASLVLDVLLAAKVASRDLRIWADMSDYKSVPGCAGGDCRKLTAAAML